MNPYNSTLHCRQGRATAAIPMASKYAYANVSNDAGPASANDAGLSRSISRHVGALAPGAVQYEISEG